MTLLRGSPSVTSRLSVSLALLAVSACGDASKSGGPAASTSAPITASATASASGAATTTSSATATTSAAAAPPEVLDPNRTAAEPERKTLKAAADDPALYANRDFVADKYGVVNLPFPLELQSVPLPRNRRAVLLTGQGPALEKPLILVVDDKGALQKDAQSQGTSTWFKDRVLAGTRERARELTLSRGPHGEVLVFWYDEPTRILAGREWTGEGQIFADYQVLTGLSCDAAQVLYWPGNGWVVVATDSGALRAQLLGEGGTLQWPEPGVIIPAAPGSSERMRPQRPKIAVRDGALIEVLYGTQKVTLSRSGATVR